MKNKNLLLAAIALLSLFAALFAIGRAESSSPDGFALLSEGSLRELGWEVEVDSRHADWMVAEIVRLLSSVPNGPIKAVSMLVWHPDSVGVVEFRRARIAGIHQSLYTFASPAEARRACEALPRRLPEWQHASLEEVRPLSMARGRGHLAVLQTLYVRSVWLVGCRGSTLMLLGILSENPQVPSELLPRLQSMVVGE